MKATYFFVPGRKTGKFFMVLALTFPERMALAKAGSFDKLIGTVGWIEEFVLKASLHFQDRSFFAFRGYLGQLDFIRDQLAKKLGSQWKIKNIFSTPSFAELLAKQHHADQAGVLNLYINHELPLLDQRRRMLYATFRAANPQDFETFLSQCKSRRPYLRIELLTDEIVVLRGYYQSGYVFLKEYFDYSKKLTLKTNVLDAEDHSLLLLKSVIR